MGIDPEKVQIEPDTKFLDPQAKERLEIQAYMQAIRDELLKPPTGEISRTTDCTASVAGPVGFEPTIFGSPHS